VAKYNKGKIVIPHEDFLKPEEIQQLTSESYIMRKLKEAGAPIRGTVYLRRDEGFDWKSYINEDGDYVYTWEKL
tara:strand:+ start:10270 stop:10491 length:222 start_codon:yes stop_codon:yes gene_type:complete